MKHDSLFLLLLSPFLFRVIYLMLPGLLGGSAEAWSDCSGGGGGGGGGGGEAKARDEET